MKITDVRTVMVAVPLARFGEFKPITMWYMTRYASIQCVIFIDTDEGITGIGSFMGDPHVILNRIRPVLIGKDPFDIELLENAEYGGGVVHQARWRAIPTDAMAGVDNALWDIVGKACNQPLYKLWGGKVNSPIHVRYWMDCRSPEEQASEALKAVERGWTSFKVKLGTDPDTDVERVRAIREAVGDKRELCLDVNGAYPLSVAINTLKRLQKYNPASVEEPVPSVWPYDSGCLDNMADIRRITGIPIEAHSHGPNCEQFVMDLVNKRAADALHVNVSFTGSVLECRRVCAIAEAGGLIVNCQSTAAELGPRNALLLHLITAERAFKGTHDSSTHFLEPPSGDIITEEFRTVNGTLKVPEGAGLGVEIDEAKLAHYHELYSSGKYSHAGGMGKNSFSLK